MTSCHYWKNWKMNKPGQHTQYKNLVLFCLVAISFLVTAADVPPDFSDEKTSQRYYSLIEEIRCLVCQNQNLADSNAELAQDLRTVVQEQIEAGKSNEEIIDFLTARYGDFVLYRPPLKMSTLLLWAGPFCILFLAAFVLLRTISKRGSQSESDIVSDEIQKKLVAVLKNDSKE